MKKNDGLFPRVILVGLLLIMICGCGGSRENKNNNGLPAADMTGDAYLFPNANLLISGKDLVAQIEGMDTEDPIIIDTRSADDYATAHIPGAVNINWNAFVADKAILKPVTDLEIQLGELGLSRTSKLVIYDDTLSSWGAAGRLFWMFEYLGCINVQILNGGWDKWAADGRRAEAAANTLSPTTFEADHTLFADNNLNKEHIADRLGDNDFVVVDTRTD